jgi:hypothetical protein
MNVLVIEDDKRIASLVLSTACGYLLSRDALKPVDRMTRAALGIGIGNLSERLPVRKGSSLHVERDDP